MPRPWGAVLQEVYYCGPSQPLRRLGLLAVRLKPGEHNVRLAHTPNPNHTCRAKIREASTRSSQLRRLHSTRRIRLCRAGSVRRQQPLDLATPAVSANRMPEADLRSELGRRPPVAQVFPLICQLARVQVRLDHRSDEDEQSSVCSHEPTLSRRSCLRGEVLWTTGKPPALGHHRCARIWVSRTDAEAKAW
jgi:hypothetical protein